MCECEPDQNPEEPDEEPTHFYRTCKHCGGKWWGLHCPHDGYQNACPHCDVRPTPEEEND